jgi:hypothetical protein
MNKNHLTNGDNWHGLNWHGLNWHGREAAEQTLPAVLGLIEAASPEMDFLDHCNRNHCKRRQTTKMFSNNKQMFSNNKQLGQNMWRYWLRMGLGLAIALVAMAAAQTPLLFPGEQFGRANMVTSDNRHVLQSTFGDNY